MRKIYLYSLIGGIILGTFLIPEVMHAQAEGIISSFAGDAIDKLFFGFINLIVYTCLTVAAGVLWISGLLLDVAMLELVVNMKATIGRITAIYTVWQTMRDLANMFLIFIILYIAIQTILGSDDYKKMLTKVVIVALFINFSLFFANVVIDASNMASTVFYTAIVGGNAQSCTGGNAGCLTYRVISGLQLDAIIAERDTQTLTQLTANATLGVFARIAGIFVILSAAFVFLASAVLLIKRFVLLIVLMMSSSLAFASQVLPQTEKLWKKWSESLITECVSTPVYFLFLWVVFKIIGSGTLKVIPTQTSNIITAIGQGSAAGTNFGADSVSLFINYAVVLGLLAAAPLVASRLGATGAGWATTVNNALQTRFGLGVAGRFGVKAGSTVLKGATEVGQAPGRVMTGLGKTTAFVSRGKFGQGLIAAGEKTTEAGKKAQSYVGLGQNGYLGKRFLDNTAKPLEKTKIYGQTREEYNKEYKEYESKRVKEVETAQKKDEFEKNVNAGLQANDAGKIASAVSKAGSGITNMPVSLLKNQQVVKHLSKSQLEAIEKAEDDKISKEDKKAIADARKAANLAKIAAGRSSGNLAKAVHEIGDEITDFKASELTPDILAELTDSQRTALQNSTKFNTTEKGKFTSDYVTELKNKVAAAATTGNVAKAVRNIGKNITNFKVSDFTPEIAGNLTKEQVTAINNSHEYSESEKDAITGLRARYHIDAVAAAKATGNPVKVSKAVKDIGENITALDVTAITSNPEIFKNLTESQLQTIDKSDFSIADKDAIKQIRTQDVSAATNVTAAKTGLAHLHQSEIAELPMTILSKPEVAAALNVGALQRILKSGVPRSTLKTALDTIYDPTSRTPPVPPTGVSSSDFNSMRKWYIKNHINF